MVGRRGVRWRCHPPSPLLLQQGKTLEDSAPVRVALTLARGEPPPTSEGVVVGVLGGGVGVAAVAGGGGSVVEGDGVRAKGKAVALALRRGRGARKGSRHRRRCCRH